MDAHKQFVTHATDTPLKACYYPALSDPAYMELYKHQAEWHLAPLGDNISVTHPSTEHAARSALKTADIIFFWKADAFWGAPAKLRRKGLVIDEYGQQAVGDKLDAFVARYVSSDSVGHKEAFFNAVKSRKPLIEQAIIIGSGPDISSLKALTASDLKTSLSIYLSTSVLNDEVCAACPPDVIIAVDGISQFGPSETGQRYREKAAELVRKYNSLVLVPAQHLPSIDAHWPKDIRKNIFAIPLTRIVASGHSFKKSWEYEPTSNVSTSFGLPCAASFTNIIKFVGVSLTLDEDLINPHTQHWEHIDESLYQRHVAPMLARHPASGQENAGYLKRHHTRFTQERAAYAALGVSFSKLGGEVLSTHSLEPIPTRSQKLSIRVRLFELISKIEHYPELVILTVFIITGLLGSALQYLIGLNMLGFLITGGIAAFLVAGLLFLRIRQTRMTARLESKLSQQQAQQFANLSERLEALERTK